MKKILLSTIALAVIGFTVLAQSSDEIAAFRSAISVNKETAKNSIKGFKYDGSKITYFNFKNYEQVKEVEVYMFNTTEYKFSINTEAAAKGIKIEVYDKSKSDKDRNLLKSIDNAAGKQLDFSSNELNAAMKKAVPNAVRLKRVYVDFVISEDAQASSSSNPMDNRGAIVLVMGYK